MYRFAAALLVTLLLTSGLAAENGRVSEVKTLVIASFESPEEIQKIKVTGARLKLTQQHVTDGKLALEIEFERTGKARLEVPAGDKPWDWHEYGGLAFDLSNTSNKEIAFGIQIDDNGKAVGAKQSASGHGTIRPRLTVSYAFPFGPTSPVENGMRGGPSVPGTEPLPYTARTRVDESRIADFTLSFDHPPVAQSVILDNIRLLPPISYDGIVDALGQYTRADWPEKVKDEDDLLRRTRDEEAQIQSAPTLPGRDEYGGWASGPQVQTTGFFGTVKRDGKWWLVDPRGHLFFSLGIDVIGVQDGFTLVEQHQSMFTRLPGPDDPLARHYGYTTEVLYGPIRKGRTFNFYTANLQRKYGPQWLDKWRDFALERLRAWGFNTIANWSDPALYELKRVPYTATVDISGDYARIASGMDYWGKMHDPFDPKFSAAVEKSLREVALRLRDDPWCIGYFIDNEISWGGSGSDRDHYGLAYGTLAGNEDSPAKKAFVEQLKLHYGQIKKLNRAWGTRSLSWSALLKQPYRPQDALTPQMREDFSNFLKAFAQQYFRVVRDALKQYDPNHLYLGCRFAWRTPEAVAAAAEYCDVVSFNIYRSHLDPEDWAFTASLNKPCIIGEFHFGALDRGLFHTGLVSTPNQKARAEMYRDYINSVADNPAFVGCHWFQYYDEPLTGRVYDGENYNIGFVTVTDTPYPEMVEAAKAVHAAVYARRAGK